MLFELPILDPHEAGGEKPQQQSWRSLHHLENAPAYRQAVRDEFMPGAGADGGSGSSRRQFLQIMGASVALAGLTGCRKPAEKILPYTRKPEEIVEGVPLYYATAFPMGGVVEGLLVESHEGRPTKVEGNPQHPVNQGATSVFAQASVLGLYDPDRSRRILSGGREATWEQFLQLARGLSGPVAVVAEATSSPTMIALRQRLLQRFPGSRWFTYDAAGDEASALGLQEVYGRPLRPLYRLGDAAVIVSLDGDFLSPTDRNHVHNVREFARGRRVLKQGDTMSRLYAVESAYTTTGGMADHRKRLRSGDVPAFAAALAARLGVGGQAAPGAAAFQADPFLEALAEDLVAAGGRGLVVAGDAQPPAVHALAARINQRLGSVGQTLVLLDTGAPARRAQDAELRELAAALGSGQAQTVLFLNANPVHGAPGDLDLVEAIRRAPNSIHAGLWFDETAAACRWHVPISHYLEAWGDGRAYDGTLSVIQPLIAPLYNTRSDVELVNTLVTGQDAPGYNLVRAGLQGFVAGDEAWNRALHDGFVADSAYAAVGGGGASAAQGPLPPSPITAALGAGAGSVSRADTLGAGRIQQNQDVTPDDEMQSAENVAEAPEGDIEVVFRLDPTVYDGRFANNAWMQECPDPVTKVVWDNVAVMSPGTAERLGLEVEYVSGKHHVDVVELAVNGRSIEIPVWVIPGHADNSITVNLGYGRALRTDREIRPKEFPWFQPENDIYRPGPLANEVGVNVAPLRNADGSRIVRGASVRRTGRSYKLATTQDHFVMEGRPIARVGTLADFERNPDFARERVPVIEGVEGVEEWDEFPTIWEDREDAWEGEATKMQPYYSQQWGMSIDLNSCTGCNACVVACQSENNVPVVGRDQVLVGREMHWLRLDRYFIGDDPDNPQLLALQPMMCVHCEYAPCEQVCPVNATSHSPDGINEMTYNRCIGTRYCSNNCPYKVRRFNFLNWTKHLPLTAQMQQNPNVTVRFRGVMEKCTYCVQRVRQAGYVARREGRDIEDQEVSTACQQACPAQAIVFGDISNPYSRAAQLRKSPLSYELLGELLTKPRTRYMARLRNPNPRLEAAAPAPAEG